MIQRINLITASAVQFAETMAEAVRLGAMDAMQGLPERSAQALADRWAGIRRMGHATALRQAYMAGRFHVEMEGKE